MPPPTPNTTTPTANRGDATTEHINRDTNEHGESNQDADSNLCLDEIPDEQSTRPATTVGRLHTESNTQSGRLASSKHNHVVGVHAEPDPLVPGKNDCTTNKSRLQLEPSNINQAKRVPKTRKTGQETGGRHQHWLITGQTQQRQRRRHQRHALVHHIDRELEM